MPTDLTLIYWAKTRAELCFVQELRDLAKRYSKLRLHFVLTHEAAQSPDEDEGFIGHDVLTRLCQQSKENADGQAAWADSQVLACGPAGFVEAARDLIATKALSFRAEGFTPSTSVVTPDESVAPADAPTVHVELTRTGRTLALSCGTSLLEALEAHGLNPPSGCRMGVCHTCVCQRHSGTTLDTQTGERSTEPDMAVRLCVSRACTDLSLDL
jgi:ferredoxin-NADP reductase